MHQSRFRYIARDGSEQHLLDAGALVAAVEAGTLAPDTMLFDVALGRWQRAAECQAFMFATEVVGSRLSHQTNVGPIENAASATVTASQELNEKRPSSAPHEPKLATARRRDPVILVAVVLALFWLGSTVAAQEIRGYDFASIAGYIVGQGLVLAILGLGIARFATRRRPAVGWAIAAGIFALIGLNEYRKGRRIADDLRTLPSAFIRGATGTDSLPLGSDTLTLNYVFGSLINSNNAAWVRYNDVVERSGDGYLSPTSLVTVAGRRQAAATISELRRATAELTRSLDGAYDVTNRRLERLGSLNSDYRQAAAGFRRSAPHQRSLIQRFLQAEHEALAVFDSLVAVVSRSPPRLASDGETLLFADNRSASAYNHWMTEIDHVVAEEEAALAALRQSIFSGIRLADSLRSVLR